jgi:quinohemoprotein ethanol dehydrogenase
MLPNNSTGDRRVTQWSSHNTSRKHSLFAALILSLLFSISACNRMETDTPALSSSSASKNASENWLRYGGGFDENHFSDLDQITTQNIDSLGLLWSYELPQVAMAGITAPIAVDGVLYYAVGLTRLQAQNAKTGKVLWQFDSGLLDEAGPGVRVAWGIRGIAYSDGIIYAGSPDGSLLAVDARSGELIWKTKTTESGDGRSITGPPYILGDLVVIGHGGGDFFATRGYVTAYEVKTGKEAWRFYMVPGDPANGFENDAMAMAAKTWTGQWWKHGGGTAWHAMAYDPALNLVYIGTGNGSPWNQKIRSPGGGDNLFLCSIVALQADTGAYAWHYQINPGETWDYNAAMDIELADLVLEGTPRKVLMTAPKNGFYYVIDRTNGKLISAEPFAKVTWAEKIDLETGRPVEIPASRFPDGNPYLVFPAMWGAHGVEAMSFNPLLNLTYIPARDRGTVYADPTTLDKWQRSTKPFGDTHNTGLGAPPPGFDVPPPVGWLSAWSPIDQREVWRVELPDTHNGGVLSTAGNLVFQGRATGEFMAYDGETGEVLWSFDTGNGIMAQPISYEVEGQQYVTLLTGWRRSDDSGSGIRWDYTQQKRRVLTFALGGSATLTNTQIVDRPIIDDPTFVVDPSLAGTGGKLFNSSCQVCHGGSLRSGGAAPDLRRSSTTLSLAGLISIVKEGALKNRGMPAYAEYSEQDVEAIQHYIRQVTRNSLNEG